MCCIDSCQQEIQKHPKAYREWHTWGKVSNYIIFVYDGLWIIIEINLPIRGPPCLSWALHWRSYGARRWGQRWPNGFGFKKQMLDGCNLELPHPFIFLRVDLNSILSYCMMGCPDLLRDQATANALHDQTMIFLKCFGTLGRISVALSRHEFLMKPKYHVPRLKDLSWAFIKKTYWIIKVWDSNPWDRQFINDVLLLHVQ